MDIKYHEAYLKLILKFYTENAFKEKGWYVVAVDPVKERVIFKSDDLSREMAKRLSDDS